MLEGKKSHRDGQLVLKVLNNSNTKKKKLTISLLIYWNKLGRDKVNRGLDGDVVAVEIISPEEHQRAQDENELNRNTNIQLHPFESEPNNVVVSEITAEPTPAEMEGLSTLQSAG